MPTLHTRNNTPHHYAAYTTKPAITGYPTARSILPLARCYTAALHHCTTTPRTCTRITQHHYIHASTLPLLHARLLHDIQRTMNNARYHAHEIGERVHSNDITLSHTHTTRTHCTLHTTLHTHGNWRIKHITSYMYYIHTSYTHTLCCTHTLHFTSMKIGGRVTRILLLYRDTT